MALLWPMSFANMPQVSGMCEAVSHSNPSSSVATHLELSSPHSTAHEELCLQQVSWKRKPPSSDPCISRRFGPCFGVCLPYGKKTPIKKRRLRRDIVCFDSSNFVVHLEKSYSPSREPSNIPPKGKRKIIIFKECMSRDWDMFFCTQEGNPCNPKYTLV